MGMTFSLSGAGAPASECKPTPPIGIVGIGRKPRRIAKLKH